MTLSMCRRPSSSWPNDTPRAVDVQLSGENTESDDEDDDRLFDCGELLLSLDRAPHDEIPYKIQFDIIIMYCRSGVCAAELSSWSQSVLCVRWMEMCVER